MNIYTCEIVDAEGYTVQVFKHAQYSEDDANAFELMVLESIRKRDNAPRYILADQGGDDDH